MATKSAGMPSEVASSASPRYLRTLGTPASSAISRQSRIASAISVGVISSSPAPSTTALTPAIALRIRSAADRPSMARLTLLDLLGGGLARADDHPSIRLLADARAGHLGVALEGEVDGSPLECLHRVESDRVAGHLHLARGSQRDLAHGVLTTLAVSLHVDDDALALGQELAHHHVGHRLQGTQGLAPPPDQRAEIAARNVESHGITSRPHHHRSAY